MQNLKFWQFTDTHLFARDPMPSQAPHTDQKTLLESIPIIDKALEMFLAEPDCDILLLSGDITCNGHADEHKALIPRLRAVQQAGKRVIVITATHDYGLTNPETRNETGLPPLEHPEGRVFRHELAGLYEEFGPRDAIADYTPDPGMSFVVQLAPGYRMLCLNDDGNGRSFCGYDEPMMEWILAQIAQAKADGQILIGTTHHPTLPPSPIYPVISQRDMLGNWHETTQRLADAGLRVMFTGHTHMMNIHPITTPAGNPYTEVNTAALVGHPGGFREVTLDGRRMTVKTRFIDDLGVDTGGLSARDYLAKHFDYLLRSIVESAANDREKLVDHANGFSVERHVIEKNWRIINMAGKYVNRATLGSVARLLCVRIPKEAKKVRVKELFLELARNIFGGTEHYGPDTPVGQAVLIIMRRVNKLIGSKLPENMRPLDTFVGSLIYDPIDDHYAEIEL
ncbi:MAG: metallophosphoesterase [Oscillospiraceae bacterium]|nr:metallophosphoesterase [Oscillospiraceae bacterium]